MRTFEIITLTFLIICGLYFLLVKKKNPKRFIYFSASAMLVAFLQIVIEHYRWQMVPAYLLIVFLLVFGLSKLFTKRDPSEPGLFLRILKIAGIVFGFILIGIAVVLPVIFPVFSLPKPTGQYPVGTTSFVLTDTSRYEIYTADPQDKRVTYVQAWYPAQINSDSEPGKMWIDPERMSRAVTDYISLPDFLFDHIALVKSNSYPNASIAEQEAAYPILVYSHGLLSFVAQNTVQMEELASHGYIVFSIEHTYEAMTLRYPQEQILADLKIHVDTLNKKLRNIRKYESLLSQISITSSPAEQAENIRAYHDGNPMEESIKVWTEDTQFLFDCIENMNSGQMDSPFAGYLDLSRIGTLGMSLGGATAFEVCSVDPRCKAALNMDGMQFGSVFENPLKNPAMRMYHDGAEGEDYILEKMTGGGYGIVIKGTTHISFSDLGLISPLIRSFGLVGETSSDQMEQIMNAYTLAFFNQSLKGIQSPLLKADNNDYPEVELKVYKASL